MLYPAYAHPGDSETAMAAELPDFPGCFAAADDPAGLVDAIAEAAELYCEAESFELPAPSRLDQLMTDDRFQGGAWILVDLDPARLQTRVKRYNVSLPERLVEQVDLTARRLHMSRSGFLARAAAAELERLASPSD